MSVSPFPDPRTTKFIPEAWQWIDLWNKFRNFIVSYPTAQNATINFAGPVYLTTRTALTQWADTAYATSEIVAWVTANVTPILGSAFTSAVLQYYFGGIRVATINPLTAGGTLAIGNGAITNNVSIMSESNTGILTLGSSGSTTRLNCPLTPLYAYPVGTATAPNTPSIGTAGTIGFIPATTFISNSVGEGTGGGIGLSVRSVSLTAGSWILYGFWKMPVNTYINSYSINFTTALNTATNEIGRKATQAIGNTSSNLVQGQTTMAVVNLTATTTYYLNAGRTPTTLDSSRLIAIRVG